MPQDDMNQPFAHPGADGGTGSQTPIIETASATTDPDNANSGNAAYVIAAIVVVVLLVIGSALGSFLSAALSYLASSDGYYEQEWDYDDDSPGQYLDGEMIDTWPQDAGSLSGSSASAPRAQGGNFQSAAA